jgi:hypothetical protein
MITKGNRVQVLDEGVLKGFAGTIDFVGSGVVAAVTGNIATVTVTSGGGGGTATQVTVTVPYASTRVSGLTVVDAGVSPTSKIMLSMAPGPDTNTTTDDDIDMYIMHAIPGTGSFEIRASFQTPYGGPLTFNYMVL